MLKLQPRYGNSCTVIKPGHQPLTSLYSITEQHLYSYITNATASPVHHYHKQLSTSLLSHQSKQNTSFALLVFNTDVPVQILLIQFASDNSIFFNTEREHSPPYCLSSRTPEHSESSGGKWSKIRCASSCKLPW